MVPREWESERGSGLRRRAKPMMGFRGIDAERTADVSGRKHASGGLDHPIKVHFWQGHSLVRDAFDLKAALEQLGEELLAGDRVIRQVMMRLVVALERHRVFDVIFGEHGFGGVEFEM
jgi:hypothetical protein